MPRYGTRIDAMPEDRPYHHGDLRRTVLEAAVELIIERGPAQLSLRELARRAGVSHAAPAHHFKDKAGLLTELAVRGHELLAEAFAEGGLDLTELGVRYVRFAAEHPAHFEVMYRPDLYDKDDPKLVAARARTAELLRAGVDTVPNGRGSRDPGMAGLAAWSLAHGFATLWLSGNLDRFLGGRDPADVFRSAATSFAADQRR